MTMMRLLSAGEGVSLGPEVSHAEKIRGTEIFCGGAVLN
jgi:hypothetical protein